jgi:hypothetical protein
LIPDFASPPLTDVEAPADDDATLPDCEAGPAPLAPATSDGVWLPDILRVSMMSTSLSVLLSPVLTLETIRQETCPASRQYQMNPIQGIFPFETD